MKVHKGQRKLHFGDGLLDSAYVDESKKNGYCYTLCIVNLGEIMRMEKEEKKKRGRPMYIATDCEGNAYLFPVPIKDCEIRVRWITYHEV